MESVSTGSNPVKEQMRDRLNDILEARQGADGTHIRKVAKKSTDERAPDFPDVPLTPGEKAKSDQSGKELQNITPGSEPKPEPAVAEVKPEDKPAAPETRTEDVRQAELNQVINDFWAKQGQIAETRAKKTNRWASLAKTLGIKTKSLDDDPEVAALEKKNHERYRELMAKGIHLYKGDKAQLENFLKQFDEFEVFRTSYNQEMEKRAEFAKFPESVLAGFQKIGKKWSELNWKQKVAISMAGGLAIGAGALALGAGTFGAAALGAGWRWGFRGFGAMAAGVGRKMQLDVSLMKDIETNQEMRLKQKMDFLKQYENDLDQGIEEIVLDGAGIKYARKEYEQRSLENSRLARNFALKVGVISSIIGESFRLGSQVTGINMGTILKKIGGVLGTGGGGAEWQPEVSKSSAPQEIPKGSLAMPEPEMEVGGGLENGAESPASGEDANLPEDSQKPAFAPEPEAKTGGLRAPDAPERIAELGVREIAPVKIGAGGTMWGSIENSIKANPGAYGLDPEDANFTKDMRKMTQTMLNEFASRKGLSYEQLDQIARTKLRAGDSFKIMFDSSNRDIYIDDFRGKAFGADVAQAEAPIQETGAGKTGVAPEEMKPKAGAGVAEQQLSRARGQIPQEVETRPIGPRLDDTPLNQAEIGEQIKQISKEAIAQVGPTRGLLNNIVTDAGIGNKGYFWGQPIGKFNELVGENLFAGEAGEPDAVDKINANKDKLRRLYEILKNYSVYGGETMDECLRKAITDPMPILGGKLKESVGSRMLEIINQEVLVK